LHGDGCAAMIAVAGQCSRGGWTRRWYRAIAIAIAIAAVVVDAVVAVARAPPRNDIEHDDDGRGDGMMEGRTPPPPPLSPPRRPRLVASRSANRSMMCWYLSLYKYGSRLVPSWMVLAVVLWFEVNSFFNNINS
jgi:hypothetical protein